MRTHISQTMHECNVKESRPTLYIGGVVVVILLIPLKDALQGLGELHERELKRAQTAAAKANAAAQKAKPCNIL